MTVGLTLLSVVRSFVYRRRDFLHAVGWLKQQGISYVYGELGDAYGAEWARQEKASALRELAFDVVPGLGQISERPMKQFAKYHVFGNVSVWNRVSEEMQAIPVHVYTDRVMMVSEYNQMLIDAYDEKEEWTPDSQPERGVFIVNARVDMIEHNQDWAW